MPSPTCPRRRPACSRPKTSPTSFLAAHGVERRRALRGWRLQYRELHDGVRLRRARQDPPIERLPPARKGSLSDLDNVDFFGDPAVVADPYPYFAAMRSKCPVQREPHQDV